MNVLKLLMMLVWVPSMCTLPSWNIGVVSPSCWTWVVGCQMVIRYVVWWFQYLITMSFITYCYAWDSNMGLPTTMFVFSSSSSRVMDVVRNSWGVLFSSKMNALKILMMSVWPLSMCIRLRCMIGVIRPGCWMGDVGHQIVIWW